MPTDPPASGAGRLQAAAFFDVDGTLVSTHIVHQYVFFREFLARNHGGIRSTLFPIWKTAFWIKCLKYLYLDRINRSRMNIAFYQNYSGLDATAVKGATDTCFDDLLKPHLFDEAVDCITEQHNAGHRVVLVTGSIDFIIAPLARYLSGLGEAKHAVDVVARTLTVNNGTFTGALNGVPIGDEEKATQMQQYADRHGVDLAGSYAFGDSVADVPMLETVGHPIAVNADKELSHIAAERGWQQVTWSRTESGR